MEKATIYLTKFELHLLKSWVKYPTFDNIQFKGNENLPDFKMIVNEETLSNIIEDIEKSDFRYNGERISFLNKMQQAGVNRFNWQPKTKWRVFW